MTTDEVVRRAAEIAIDTQEALAIRRYEHVHGLAVVIRAVELRRLTPGRLDVASDLIPPRA